MPRVSYSNRDKAMLMWSVAIGSMIGTFPFSLLYTRYGARYVLFAAGILSSLSTALIPMAAILGLPYFIALRFAQVRRTLQSSEILFNFLKNLFDDHMVKVAAQTTGPLIVTMVSVNTSLFKKRKITNSIALIIEFRKTPKPKASVQNFIIQKQVHR